MQIKRVWMLSLLIVLLVNRGYTQEIELFGYIEPQLTVQSDEFSRELFSTKFRLDIQGTYGENIFYAGNVNLIEYRGDQTWNILNYLPDSLQRTVAPDTEEFYALTFEDDIELDNAFVKLMFDNTDLLIGKQQISLGTGYVWNPTDVFNRKDLVDPTYEQPGHDSIRLDYVFSNRFEGSIIYAPDDDYERSQRLIRLKGGVGHFDFSCIAIDETRELTDFILLTPSDQERVVVGGDLFGELFGLGIWEEFAHSNVESADDFYESVTGADYTFENELYVMTEYYRNTEVPEGHKDYDLNDWMRYITGETKSIARDQIYSSVAYPLTELVTISNAVIVSLNDQSTLVIPSLDYNIFENAELSFFGSFTTGATGTVYGQNFGDSFLARLRIYF